MNISQPVASAIGSVDFGFLSTAEIKSLSVKRIQNPITFDILLHPVPGGLYDLALGAWGDNPCATCQLKVHSCPGHVGHIELPVQAYHPIFMDQLLRLLRAKCVYCHHFRMSRVEVNKFTCRLRLIQHGLLLEMEELENIHIKPKSTKRVGYGEGVGESVNTTDSESEEEVDALAERRTSFVERAIRNAVGTSGQQYQKNEAISRERRRVVKEFLASITKGKKCANCRGSVYELQTIPTGADILCRISPTYRKDKYAKIFQKPLGSKEQSQMVQGGFKASNALLILKKDSKTPHKRKRDGRSVDEGIVADVADEITEEEEEITEEEGDAEMGGMVETEAAPAKGSPKKSSKTTNVPPASHKYMSANEVHAALTLLFEKETEILTLIYNHRVNRKVDTPVNADIFFIRALAIPPSKYRPETKTGDGEIAEAPQNSLYKSILTHCENINQIYREISSTGIDGAAASIRPKKRDMNDLMQACVNLQDAVNSLIDRDRNPIQGAAGMKNEDGIKQKLEKKEGLFRKNMMGKRVNFAARSVISPDPNIETNEIGVPPVFAKKLTYPEPVTNHNFYDLKEAVLNGVGRWPGATAIENENGQVINLRTKSLEERRALANQLLAPSSTSVSGARGKKVHRHLNNGDIVLMNRQPTLHKPSIMGHRARVLPGEKTIRMHYANCNTYNADFDGDEMNMHFPQNEIARAEALQIADTDHQYLVATSGKPLRGLIQDHISMGVWLTNRDTFFNRENYQQLLYSCLRPENNHTTSDRILTMTPAIIKPRPMWSGKQIISTVLNNIRPASHPPLTLTSKSSTAGDRWGDKSEEGTVIFRDGELLCGILDKSQFGASGGGLVHSIYEVYGHTVAGRLLGILGRLLTKFLHMRAFTCGVEDLLLTEKGNDFRKVKLEEADVIGLEVAAKYVGLEGAKSNDLILKARLEEVLHENDKQAGLDGVVNSRTRNLTSDLIKECMPAGLAKPFPKNHMQTMTTSGAKGSSVNASLISCNLGQQVLEGRRVPIMVSGKTLPCFKPFETNIRAGGYITDRFLTGIRPQEYFFHCMAGREGLIDTAVKTSRSGYLQRCLIKGMEGLRVEYDNTVRDSDGSMVQFLYGEDGLDVTKQKHLTEFKFIAENVFSFVEQLGMQEEFDRFADDEAMKWNKAAMKEVKKTGRIDAMDPVLAHYSPSRHLYSTSETFAEAYKRYISDNPDKLITSKRYHIEGKIKKRYLEACLNMKYLKSTVEPGEAVGIIAGQSIGEPSTQMTLNTFHLAGHSAKNVTLGIPRLREIVMTASDHIATPTMTLIPNPELSGGDHDKFAKAISRLSLAEITDNVTVSEKIGCGAAYARAKIYSIHMSFYPSEEYGNQHAIQIEDVVRTLESKFVPRLQRITRAELKKKGEEKSLKTAAKSDALPVIGQSVGVVEEAQPAGEREGRESDGDDDDDDGDATNAKQKANRAEAVSYAAPDEEEEAIASQARRDASPDVDMEDEGIGRSPREAHGESEDEREDSPTLQSRKAKADQRAGRIMSKNNDVTSFKFDDKKGEWCELQLEYSVETAKLLMLTLVEKALRDAVIQSIPGIGSCNTATEKVRENGQEIEVPVIITEGVNLTAMRDYQDIINPNKIFTNDIAGMLRHYGVEACRVNIIREMDAVFKGHGIAVDNRHLNLIADMMTRGGGFTPFNRNGLTSSVSPFMKMSFETTVGFLRDAALETDWDDLKNPSSRIVIGRVGRVGTGSFDVLMRVS
ncbi:hypothetical protein FGG08_005523 [Glutinoglossum americanum]|uniref:DNA-directed RNA polymerase subunit n=1 Tax=Glutinoglossum americanum TaxID=1670608 RepID=A0A9P8I730_9PEZI|nr:hypothetical protein FGG08_005523 [Glutinoglossum americanum]